MLIKRLKTMPLSQYKIAETFKSNEKKRDKKNKIRKKNKIGVGKLIANKKHSNRTGIWKADSLNIYLLVDETTELEMTTNLIHPVNKIVYENKSLVPDCNNLANRKGNKILQFSRVFFIFSSCYPRTRYVKYKGCI